MRCSPLILTALLAGCATLPAPNAAMQDDALYTEVFADKPGQAQPGTLIFIVHDDGDPGARSDEAAFAQAAVRAIPDTTSITLLRPGFRDAKGNASSGEHGTGKGDNFTADRLARLYARIEGMKRRSPNARVILVGDGGGAALVADLAGLHPEVAHAILLVGCPCALPEWRSHMADRTGDPAWKAVVSSLDPLKFAGGVSTTLRVAVLVGADDAVTPVALSRAYVEALTLRGIGTDYRIVPARGHDLLGDPETMSALTRLAATMPEKP